MNRLTKKNNGTGSWTQFGDKYLPAHNIKHKQCVNKLGQLEDIEEEIGIDLEILYKVLKSESIWIKKHIGAGKFRIVEVNIRGLNINKYTNEITIRDENNSLHILNGYGKMWALTREELEEVI